MTAVVTTLAALQDSGRTISVPFTLALPDGNTLHCTDVLRLLPRKRLVMRATLDGNTVLAKLFFDTRHGKLEATCYTQLQKTGVKTPALLAQHAIDGGSICLYAFIGQATPLDALWQQADDTRKHHLLEQLLDCLQTLWRHKLLQRDLHLGNFLLQQITDTQEEILWVLDPASIQPFTQDSEREDNLALLLSQLPFADWPMAQQSLPVSEHVSTLARQHWQQRLHNYLEKICRDCSDVADISPHKNLRVFCRRNRLDDSFVQQLRNPALLTGNATVLKNGNSAKVFLVEIGGRKMVVKQYVNKDWLRKIRRAFQLSRAARSWRFSHAFAFAGIDVPAPVAFIEQKSGPFVTSAWFVCEYAEGSDLLASWHEREPSSQELLSIQSLFLRLQKMRCSHGDMKATNLLSDGKSIALIDYDGAREHRNDHALQQALDRDRQRFLQNWADRPALQKILTGLIGA